MKLSTITFPRDPSLSLFRSFSGLQEREVAYHYLSNISDRMVAGDPIWKTRMLHVLAQDGADSLSHVCLGLLNQATHALFGGQGMNMRGGADVVQMPVITRKRLFSADFLGLMFILFAPLGPGGLPAKVMRCE